MIMKKKLFCALCVFCVLLITGCNNKSDKEADPMKDYTRYAMHIYDADAMHTEEMEMYFDKDGNFKKFELYMVYDSGRRSCNGLTNVEERYPGANLICTELEDGKVKIYMSITDESIESGVLEDDEFHSINSAYEDYGTEEEVKKNLEKTLEYDDKDLGIRKEDDNYVIIANERIDFN